MFLVLLSAIVFLLCLTALITFWEPHGLFSAVTTSFCGGLIILITSFSPHQWAHGLAVIGWLVVALIAFSGLVTLILIMGWPHAVLKKRERLTGWLRLAIAGWLLLSAGWSWAALSGHFTDTLWPWLTFIPVYSLYLGLLYAASLIGFWRVSLVSAHHADNLVVLGAGLHRGHIIGRTLQSRLDTALALATQQDHPVTIIVTGGQGADEDLPEASAMAAYLKQHHFPAANLIEEPVATNTFSNLLNSQPLWAQLPQQGGRVVVVTSNYHLFRTQILAHQLGLHLGGAAAPTRWGTLPLAWAREFLAIVILHPRLHRSVLLALLGLNILGVLIF